MTALARSLAIVLLLTLAACGWRFSGQGGTSLDGVKLLVDTTAAEAGVRNSVLRSMRAAGATLVQSREQADAVLVLLGETVQQRAISISAQARVQEYELVYGLRYRLEAAEGEALIPDETVQAAGVYQYESGNVLSTQSRASTLTDRLRQDAVRLLLPRVQAALRQPAQE